MPFARIVSFDHGAHTKKECKRANNPVTEKRVSSSIVIVGSVLTIAKSNIQSQVRNEGSSFGRFTFHLIAIGLSLDERLVQESYHPDLLPLAYHEFAALH